MVILKKGKLVKSDGIHLPSQEIMKEVDEKRHTYLGILELNGKDEIQAINTCAVALLRYGAGIINWKVDKLTKIDRTTRKTLTMYGVLHPKSDIDRLYLKRKHGGRSLISIEICIRLKENNLDLYVRGLNEMLLKGVKKLVLSKLKVLWKKKTSKKIAKMSLKTNGTKREFMDSFFMKFLNK